MQLKLKPPSQLPFHLVGIGPYPSSLKLFDSGRTPVLIPIIIRRCTQISTNAAKCPRTYEREQVQPVSMLPMMVDSPKLERFQSEFEGTPPSFSTPRKFHDRVVCSCSPLFSYTDITSGCSKKKRKHYIIKIEKLGWLCNKVLETKYRV